MSFFHRTGGDFAPLFRLLDDYDTHRSGRAKYSAVTNFAPRFDVRESENSYHLDGELPGINQKDIQIEFSDPQTLVIKGRSVREYNNTNNTDDGAAAHSPKPVTVEDESESSDQAIQQVSNNQTTVSKKHDFKYWVSERSVGEFHRSFNFPNRVDQDAVKANLNNGILSIVVPKAAPPVGRKITIE